MCVTRGTSCITCVMQDALQSTGVMQTAPHRRQGKLNTPPYKNRAGSRPSTLETSQARLEHPDRSLT